MTKKKDPTISKSKANQKASLKLKALNQGIFSKESKLKMKETKIKQGQLHRKRKSMYVLPHLKLVYLHYHLETKEYFWCGHGNWKRPYKNGNRSNAWKEYIKKHGSNYEVIIVQAGLKKEFALWLETQLTKQIGTIQLKDGPLLNKIGTGKNIKQTEEFKANVRKGIIEWHRLRKAQQMERKVYENCS